MSVITPLARKYAPWSFSKAELAETCPLQFGFRHISKTVATTAATSDTKVGIVAHAILEHRVTGSGAGTARKLATEKTPLTTAEQEMLRLLNENMETFLKRFDAFCKSQGVTKIFNEVEWGFDENWAPVPFFDPHVFFRGKLDLGALTRDGDLFVIDHKSGMAKDLAQDAKKRQQLQAYAVLGAANLPSISGVRGGIHFLQGDDPEMLLQWTDYLPIDRIKQLYVPWLFGRINTSAAELTEPLEARPAKTFIKSGPSKGKPGWPCGWCLYQGICPGFKERFGG